MLILNTRLPIQLPFLLTTITSKALNEDLLGKSDQIHFENKNGSIFAMHIHDCECKIAVTIL